MQVSIPERNDSMQKPNQIGKKQTVLWLLLIYTGSVAIRYALAVATRNFPTVYMDEYLYYTLGRSIATKGSLLYYGQPADYTYIIYPLFLSPVYLLFGHGTNFFRMIQLWNILLMSLSVFPIYGLCKAIIQKQKTALWLTGLFMLLPCFMLGEYIFSEAVIYPMFYTLMYCIYRYLKEEKIRYSVWTGILGAVLYYTKPGAVIPAALALLLFAGKAVRKKSGKDGMNALAGLGCLAAFFFVIKLIAEQVLGYHGVLLSLYDYQSPFAEGISNEYFFRVVGKYPYYFILAGGILPFLVSVRYFPEYDREDKRYYLLVIACALLTMVGTAWVVNRTETLNILFLRYVEMYLPILFMYCMLPHCEGREISARSSGVLKVLCFAILAYMTAGTLAWGSTAGIGTQVETHFLVSLSALFTSNVMGIANIIIVLLSGLTLYLLSRDTEKQVLMKACCTVLVVFAVLNNIAAYVNTGNNTSKALEEESKEINRLIGDKEYLHIHDENQCDCGLDINSRYNICQISDQDLLQNLLQNQGRYTPFVPASARGMNAAYETPDTDTLVADQSMYQRIKFNENLPTFLSSKENFKLITFSKDQRIVNSIVSEKTEPDGDAKATYVLTVYNEEWLTNPVKIRLEIESPEDQGFVITADKERSAALTKGRNWYEIKTANPVTEYFFSAKDQDIQIYDYEITVLEPTE